MVSISSSNGRFGGCAMVSRSGVATKFSAGSGLPSSASERSFNSSPSSTSGAGVAGRVRLELELGANRGRRRMQRYVEFDGFDEPIGRAVILEADGAGFFGAHDAA